MITEEPTSVDWSVDDGESQRSTIHLYVFPCLGAAIIIVSIFLYVGVQKVSVGHLSFT